MTNKMIFEKLQTLHVYSTLKRNDKSNRKRNVGQFFRDSSRKLYKIHCIRYLKCDFIQN